MISDRDRPGVEPVPDVPEYRSPGSVYRGTKEADPDLILFDDASLPIDILTDLLFENIGGQEILSVSRNDLLNGQNVRYQIISNLGLLAQEYNSRNMFKVPGTLADFFNNFAISFLERVPRSGTAPAPYYVGAENSNGCTGFPVLDRRDDTLIQCFTSLTEARNAIDNDLAPYRDTVYSDITTGDIVIDVENMRNNERVEIEVLTIPNVENDTIY